MSSDREKELRERALVVSAGSKRLKPEPISFRGLKID